MNVDDWNVLINKLKNYKKYKTEYIDIINNHPKIEGDDSDCIYSTRDHYISVIYENGHKKYFLKRFLKIYLKYQIVFITITDKIIQKKDKTLNTFFDINSTIKKQNHQITYENKLCIFTDENILNKYISNNYFLICSNLFLKEPDIYYSNILNEIFNIERFY